MRRQDNGVPLGQQVAYGLGIAGPVVFWIAPQLVLLYFLTDVLGVPPGWAPIALLLPKLWEVVADPALGLLSDRTRSRLGRRRPYMLAGTLLFPACFALMFAVPAWSAWRSSLTYVTAAFLACTTAYSLFMIPFSALGTEMATDPAERTRVATFRLTFFTVAMLAFGTAVPMLVAAGDRQAYRRMGAVLGGLAFVLMAAGIVGTWRTRETLDDAPGPGPLKAARAVLANRRFVVLATIFFVQNVAINGGVAILPYYSKYVWGNEAQAGTIFLVFFLGVLAGTPLCAWLAERHGRYAVFAMATVVYAMANASLFWMGPASAVLFYAALLVSGMGAAAGNLFTYALLPEVIDEHARRTGTRREGLFNGAWVSLDKLNTALGAAAAGAVLAWSGYVPSAGETAVQPASALLAIRVVLTLGPSAVLLASLLPISLYPGLRSGENSRCVGHREENSHA